jgi:osmotically-inducible protein OsmY
MKTNLKNLVIVLFVISLSGCAKDEVDSQRVADAAVAKAEQAAAEMSKKLRGAYEDAYAQGRKIAGEIGEKASDQVLKAKVLAAFKLIEPLDSSDIEVRVEEGVIHLSGTVNTEQERMIAEGLAYGVTGDGKRVQSTLTVPKP